MSFHFLAKVVFVCRPICLYVNEEVRLSFYRTQDLPGARAAKEHSGGGCEETTEDDSVPPGAGIELEDVPKWPILLKSALLTVGCV